MFTPKNGKVLTTKGRIAQCMAHPSDVAIPKKSQFTFKANAS